MPSGQCHCGAIRYQLDGEPVRHALCHCKDCRRHAGAPMVAWAIYPARALNVSGVPRIYPSSEHGRRHFCGDCGTGLFYTNDVALPDTVNVQSATLDEPNSLSPEMQVQTAERLSWVQNLNNLPAFARYSKSSG
jgi:hypothetical protein